MIDKTLPKIILSNAKIPSHILNENCIYLDGIPLFSQAHFWNLRGKLWKYWAKIVLIHNFFYHFPGFAAPGSTIRRSMLGNYEINLNAVGDAIKKSSSGPEFIAAFFNKEAALCKYLIDSLPSHAFVADAFLKADSSHSFVAVPFESFMGEGKKSHFFRIAANNSLEQAAVANGGRLNHGENLASVLKEICIEGIKSINQITFDAQIPVDTIKPEALPLWADFLRMNYSSSLKRYSLNLIISELKKLATNANSFVFIVLKTIIRIIILFAIFIIYQVLHLFHLKNHKKSQQTSESIQFNPVLQHRLCSVNTSTVNEKVIHAPIEFSFFELDNLINKKLQQITIDFPKCCKNRTFAVAIAFTGRHELLAQICTLLISYEENQTIILVGSTEEDERFGNLLMRKYRSQLFFFKFPNSPLGAKWQFTIKATRVLEPQSLIILGSDDLIGPEFYSNAKKLIESYKNKAKIFALDNWMLFDCSGDSQVSGFPWRLQYKKDMHSISLGAGRIYTREALNLMGWNLFPLTLEKALDKYGESQAHEYGVDIEILPSVSFPLLSIKANHTVINTTINMLRSKHISAKAMDFKEATLFWDAFPNLYL
jgi:hypothetical protein